MEGHPCNGGKPVPVGDVIVVFDGGMEMLVPEETAVPAESVPFLRVDVAIAMLVITDVRVGGYVVVRGPNEEASEVAEPVGLTPPSSLVSVAPLGEPVPLFAVPVDIVPLPL